MKDRYKMIVPVLILGMSIALFLGLKFTKPIYQTQKPSERVWTVDVVEAHLEPLSPSLTLYGRVETADLIKAASPNRGRVKKIFVKEGEAVTTGHLLLVLDERDYQPPLLQAQAKVTELEAEINREQLRYKSDKKALDFELSLLKLAEAAVDRANTMKAKNLGSASSYDEARENLERQRLAVNTRKFDLNEHAARRAILEAQLQQQRAELEMAQLDWERSRIYAEFDGFIAKVEVAQGDQVTANQQLITLYPTDALEIRALIPAPYQAEVQSAVLDGSKLDAQALIGNKITKLKLDRLAGQADNRGIDGLFSIDGVSHGLRLGSRVSLTLYRPVYQDAIVLPFEALYGHDRVYKIVDERLSAVIVRVLGDYSAGGNKSMLLVTSSQIEEGDFVLTTHLPNALNGLKVQLKQAQDDLSADEISASRVFAFPRIAALENLAVEWLQRRFSVMLSTTNHPT